jgi:hypothetical protein
MVVPAFSSARLTPTRVPIRAGLGGMTYDSVPACEQIATLHKMCVVEGPPGPPISPAWRGRVNRAIRRALGEVVPEPSS